MNEVFTSMMTATPATRLQLFGQRCSGTNFFQKLVEVNLRDLPISFEFGFKHSLPLGIERAGMDVLVCVIVREPFDWVRSLHRQPWHVCEAMRGLSLDEFLRHPWHCVYDEQSGTPASDPLYGSEMMFERDPASGHRYASALKMRSDRLRRWWAMRPCRPVWWVQYEALRRHPALWIRNLALAAGRAPPRTFVGVERYKGFRQGRKYKPIVEKALSRSTECYLCEQLDWSIESLVGYFPRATATTAGGESAKLPGGWIR